MKNRSLRVTLAVLAATCLLAFAGTAGADPLPTSDSETDPGWWKYEMNVKPSAENLDGNAVDDFTEDFRGGGTASASYEEGILTITSNRSDRLYYTSGVADALELWSDQGYSYARGYTFEIRLKVISDSGDLGAIMVYPTPSDSDEFACLNIKDTGQWWGTSGGSAVGDPLDNTDAFHVFRVAQAPAENPGEEVYHVWRDGVPLADDLGSGLNLVGYNFMRFGDTGTNSGGVVEIDYFRFRDGAYAPIPEPSTLVLLVGAALALLVWRRR